MLTVLLILLAPRVFICRRFLLTMLRWHISIHQISANNCCLWYWHNISKQLHFTGVTLWILPSNRLVSFCWSAFDTFRCHICVGYFQCNHHIGWFRVEHGSATCTLVLVHVLIQLSESQWVLLNTEIQCSGYGTIGYGSRHFADLIHLPQMKNSNFQSQRSTNRLDMCTHDKIAESTAISVMKLDGTDNKSWSFEIEILSVQKQVLGIVVCTEEALDGQHMTECKAGKRQHGIAQLTILHVMERWLPQRYDIQKYVKALSNQLQED